MFLRYCQYIKNKETLTSMAYMCLTVLEASARGRKEASKKYNIDYKVLDTLGNIVSTKGGPTEIRKYSPIKILESLSEVEKNWIIAVIKKMIYRAGEYAYNNHSEFQQITLDNFPKLP